MADELPTGTAGRRDGVSERRTVPGDPLADVARLEGVGAAAAHARDAVDALLRHPVLRQDAGRVAAESVLRGAHASASLESAAVGGVDEAVLQGALRATGEVPVLARTWERAPLQALARLHLLAARDLAVAADLPPGVGDVLGRPRPDADASRLAQVAWLAAGPTSAPAAVVAAVVHGELLAVRPFGSADGVVARAVERVVLVARGVDTKAVLVPEVGHLALRDAYGAVAVAYASGSAGGVAAWVRHCCAAYAAGAEEGLAICHAML